MANDMMMAFAKEIMGKTDHLEDKLAFLGLQTTKEYFYAYLRCFICGMSCQQTRKIFDQGKYTVEDISEWMLEDLGKRIAEHGDGGEEARELQAEAARLRQQLMEIEEHQKKLKETLEVKERERGNLDASMEAKDRVQEQLKEKIGKLNQSIAHLEKENAALRKREEKSKKESIPDGETRKAETVEQKERTWIESIKSFFEKKEGNGKGEKIQSESGFMKDELAKESFRTEVLLNAKFSAEQKDFLFSLLEEGESYVNIRPFANPLIPVEDMKRYHNLCIGKEGQKWKI